MTITEILNQPEHSRFSLELLPPLKGQHIDSIYRTMDALMPFDPAFVDVTYHREEYVYREVGPGLLQKRTVRKRPGTVGICAALTNRYNIETVPHIICGGFSVEETENALIDLDFVGVRNVLALRGDAIRSEGRFKPEPDGHPYAIDLVKQVVDLNKGIYLDPDLRNSTSTDFCIGVAGYPEKHFQAPNPASDLRWLKEKVDAGASYVITQMFFDNAQYFQFVERCREADIHVPIIPGLKPLTTAAQLAGAATGVPCRPARGPGQVCGRRQDQRASQRSRHGLVHGPSRGIAGQGSPHFALLHHGQNRADRRNCATGARHGKCGLNCCRPIKRLEAFKDKSYMAMRRKSWPFLGTFLEIIGAISVHSPCLS